jgi:hypothetical protein
MEDDASAAIYQGIFQSVERLKAQHFLRSYTTLAYADVVFPHWSGVVASMNGASGLVSNAFRATPGVSFFSINSTIQDGSIISLDPNAEIKRAPNRHAEMNIVMFILAEHLQLQGGTVQNFALGNYVKSLNPSQAFCPECQLAIALLCRGGANLISSISDHIIAGGAHTLALRSLSDRMLSPNWAPPWTNYYRDVPGSLCFRNAMGGFANGRGPFLITFGGGDVTIMQPAGDDWAPVWTIPAHHG